MPAQYGNQVYQPQGNIMGQQTARQPSFGTRFKEFFTGSPMRSNQLALYTPEAQQMMSNAMRTGFEGLKQFDFEPIRQQAMQNYQQNIVPGLAERFTSMGGRRSSGFQQALGASGANLMSNLAALEEDYNVQRQPMFQDLMKMGMQQQWENVVSPETTGFGAEFLKNLLSSGGQMASQFGSSVLSDPKMISGVVSKLLPLLGLV